MSQEKKGTAHIPHPFSRFHMEMDRYGDRKKLILVSGVKNIMTYTTEEVVLNMGGEFLSITGKSLLCRTYVNGTVEVIGEIGGMGISVRVARRASES